MNERNNIPAEQATPDLVKLAHARQNTFKTAKWAMGAFVIVSIALPALGAFLARWDEAKPYFALAGLVLLIVDVALLQPTQKDSIKRAAKLAEEFDTKVFKLPWNSFVAGEKVAPEDIRKASKRPLSTERKEQIASWYESSVGEVPLRFGRLVCQRTNIHYDERLRRQYVTWLLSLTTIVGGVLFLIAFAKDSKLSEFVMGLAVPFTPVLAWVLRERRKQVDTAASLDRLQSEFQKIWREAIAGASEKETESRSRQLQDAIYQHRSSAPLLFDWVYTLLRDKNEDEAHHAARALVNEAKAAVAAKETA